MLWRREANATHFQIMRHSNLIVVTLLTLIHRFLLIVDVVIPVLAHSRVRESLSLFTIIVYFLMKDSNSF
jgi:hypothetical protein